MKKLYAILLVVLCSVMLMSFAQAGQYGFSVLMPEQGINAETFIVIALPAYTGSQSTPNFHERHSDFLKISTDNNLASKYNCIIVYLEFPWHEEYVGEFNQDPWYVDSEDGQAVLQESYVVDISAKLKTLFPEKTIYLMGYSKSGFGAMHLLFKYPEYYAGSAVFDAPLMLYSKTRFRYPGTQHAFSSYSDEEFDTKINLVNRLVNYSNHHKPFLWLGIKADSFTSEMNAFVEQLQKNGMKACVEEFAASVPHAWNISWIEPGIKYFKEGVCENSR